MNINFDGLVCYLNAKPSSKKQEQWIDSSSNNNNAILTNVSDNDFNGEYIQFTGNNYATLPRCIQDDFTISAEVVLERSTSTNDAAQAWFSYAALIDAEASGIRNDFGLTISKDGHAYFGVGNPDQTISYTQQSLFNKKHVITCTRHKTTGAIALYIDGNLIKKHFHPNKSSLTYSPSIYIGKGINNKYLLMKLFSVRLYNRVLNEFEIKQDMFLIKEKEYVNNNNLPKIVEKLSAASNIKITGNKYGNRVQTVIDKIVEKADNVTKAINQEVVNNTHSFKAGTGNNVNVSSDVQDSFSEIAIKGQTYQNLFNISQLYKDLSSFAIQNGSIEFLTHNSVVKIVCDNMLLLKPNTQYTIIANCERMCSSNEQNIPIRMNNDGTDYGINIFGLNVTNVGITSLLFTTPSDISNLKLLFYNNSRNIGFKFKYILILEGDHINNPNLPSYFEGIVGVGDKSKTIIQLEEGEILTKYKSYYNGHKIQVISNGKNIINLNPTKKTISGSGTLIGSWSSSYHYINIDISKIKGMHSVSAKQLVNGQSVKCMFILSKDKVSNNHHNGIYNETATKGIEFGIEISSGSKTDFTSYNYLHITTGNVSAQGLGTLSISVNDIQIEEGTTVTNYESYKQDKLEFLLNEPLMKLPNGVCDEITKDGKLVRRIGKIVLNGNEAWFNNGPWSGGDYQACYIRISNKGGNKLDLVCDKFGVTSQKTNSSNQVTNECCFGEVGNGVLYLIISKQKLSTPDMSGLKRWLSDNPTTVYYELSNPIITDLNNQIKIFKDGHLTFNTLVAPESTHIVQLNKSAQIHNAIKQSQLLDNKIAVLENNYDSLVLSTMSTLNDLELDYTLK